MSPTYRDFLSEDERHPGMLLFGGARMALLDIKAGFWGLRRQMEALVGPRLTDAMLQQSGANGGASFARAFVPEITPQNGAQALRDCIAAYQAAGFGHFEVQALEWPIGRVLIRAENTFEAWMMRQHGQKAESPVCAYTAGVLVGFVNALAGRHDVVCIERACQAQGAESCLFELLPAPAAGDVPVVAIAPDPAMGRELNLLEMLFDRMPMVIAIFDRDYRLRRCNPTWVSFTTRYTPSAASQVVPGVSYFDLLPGTEPTVLPLFEQVLAGNTVRQEAVRLETNGIVSYWDVVLAPLIENGEVVGILDVGIDATERVQTEKELREKEAQYRGIFESTSDALLMFDLDGVIVEANPAACRMYGYPYEELIGLSGKDLVHPDYYHLFEDFKRQVKAGGHFSAQTVDLRKDGSPINIEVHGASFSYSGKPHLLAVARDISETVLARQTLERRVEERTHEIERRRQVAEGLRDIIRVLNSNQPVGEILDYIVTRAGSLLSTAAAVYRLDDVSQLLTIQASQGLPPDYATGVSIPISQGVVGRAVQERQPVAISDLTAAFPKVDGMMLEPQRRVLVERLTSHYRAALAVPLIIKGEIYGGIAFYFAEPREFSDEEIGLAVMFADQATLAIENARLRAQAGQSAVAAERSRLARDLHDAVTQTLFSASLIAEVLPRLWERDPDEGQRRLEELRQLTRGALAEMRTLLLELRPSALADTPLADLLRQLGESITGRARVPVTVEVEEECSLPPEVKVTLYRIAQEALNNIAKHAGATQASVRLRCQSGRAALHISDDGRGFGPQSISPDSLGLGIMRERAEAIGATLEIESEPDCGTQVVVAWTKDERRMTNDE